MDVREEADIGGDVHFIDRFKIAIPGTVPNCVDESNSLAVQGQHGIGILTLAYFNLTTDPITSCSSADVFTFSAGTQSYSGKFFIYRGNSNATTICISLVPVDRLSGR